MRPDFLFRPAAPKYRRACRSAVPLSPADVPRGRPCRTPLDPFALSSGTAACPQTSWKDNDDTDSESTEQMAEIRRAG